MRQNHQNETKNLMFLLLGEEKSVGHMSGSAVHLLSLDMYTIPI